MTGIYAFATEAIVAFLYDEPGHEYVGELLEAVEADAAGGFLSETNAGEVYYLIAQFGGRQRRSPRRRHSEWPTGTSAR